MLGGQDDVKNIANKRSKSSSALLRINNKSIDNINDNNNKLNRSFSKTNIKDNALLFDDADKQNKNNISNYINDSSKADEAYEDGEEPIYAVSDFEGRYDYYIRFFTDIGFFDKDALCNAVKTQIEKSGKQEEEKNKELEMLRILFTKSPEEWFEKIIKHLNILDAYMSLKVPGADNVYKTNIERLNFLKTYFTEDVLKSAINKNFKGKIVINGDLYSSRVNDLFGKKEDNIVSINELCFNALKAIKTNNDVKDKLILVAGNHDVYHMDYIDGQYYDSNDDDILQDIKNATLPFLTKWFKVKTKDGKMLIFKHSPRLMEDEIFGKDLSEIIDDKNDCMGTGLNEIINYNTENEKDPMKSGYMYQYYFYNGFNRQNTFNSDSKINNDVKKILEKNNAKLVVGHCHVGGKIKDGCICIDDDGEYKYRVFHFEKKKDISNDKNNVDDECNSFNNTRESIYFDDIHDNVMLEMSANNANSNNNNNNRSNNNIPVNSNKHNGPSGSANPIFNLPNNNNSREQDSEKNNINNNNNFAQRALNSNNNDMLYNGEYINIANPNITDEEIIKHIKENKDVLPAGLNINDIKKLRGKGEVNNVSAQHIDKDKSGNNTNIKDTINNSSLKQNNDSYNNENPIFKIINHLNKKSEQQDNNNTEQKQDDNNNTEQNKHDNKLYRSLFTFGSTNTATFNQQQPQNKEVSCEMVRNCLSSIGECFNCKCS